MGTKAVLINTPKNTVQSDAHDWASIFNSIIGDVSGVLDYGKKLELKKINDNTVQLQDGVYSMQGHIIKVDKNTTQNLTITSGTLGMNRLDAVVVEYEKAADPEENDTFEFKVIRGTPVNEGGSSPVLPQLVKQDLLAGGSKRQELLYSVLIQNTEIKEINFFFKEVSNIQRQSDSLNDIKDYIVDFDENQYGSWEKWNSGKMTLTKRETVSIPVDVLELEGFRTESPIEVYYGQTFVGTPIIKSITVNALCWGSLDRTSPTYVRFYGLTFRGTRIITEVSVEVEGRWK